MKVARACEPASARLSLQSMSLSHFRNRCYLIAEKYNVASQSPIYDGVLVPHKKKKKSKTTRLKS